jgi:cytochrome c oxidase subunit II
MNVTAGPSPIALIQRGRARNAAAGAIFALLVLFAGCAGSQPAGEQRRITVLMKKYAVEPAEIRVKQGESVTLEVSTQDVQHGFDIPELGVKEPVQPGRPAVFMVPTGRKGEFKISCGVLCGARHDDMTGKFIVE